MIKFLAVPFDAFNFFHRWVGRIVILEAIAHSSLYFAQAGSTLRVPYIEFGLVVRASTCFGMCNLVLTRCC